MGLRERKREQTRRALADAALGLFAERGYDATTIADIADRAGVSPRTFFSHHDSKEHVIFWEDDGLRDSLAAHLAARRPGEQALAALRTWITELLDGWDIEERVTLEQTRRDVIDRTPTLLMHERQQLARFETVLRDAVAHDLGEAPGDLRPRLVAATAAAALDATRPVPGTAQDSAEILERLDQALAFLRGGMDALAPGRAPAAT